MPKDPDVNKKDWHLLEQNKDNLTGTTTTNAVVPVAINVPKPPSSKWVPGLHAGFNEANKYADDRPDPGRGRGLEPLPKDKRDRLSISTEIVFRGDSRSPDQIVAARGLFPRSGEEIDFSVKNKQSPSEYRRKDFRPDVHVGYENPQTTVYVSTARSFVVAKGFGGKYVYRLRVVAGVDMTKANQHEIMAFGGVELKDVIGVKVLESGNIYLNKHFLPGGLNEQVIRQYLKDLRGS